MPVNSMLRIDSPVADCYVDGVDAKEIRVANLRRYIRDLANDSQAEFARLYGMSAAHVSQLLTRHRDIGDKLARELETKLGLERGEMDRLPAPYTAPIDPLLSQLMDFYTKLSPDGKDALLGSANRLYVMEHPERSPANPFPLARPEIVKPKRRGK